MPPHLSRAQRLSIIIGISSCFFVVEISAGLYTGSVALIADAFHYMNDLVGFIIALAAVKLSERTDSPEELSFGWGRAQLLGAFFNGVFLLALGASIFIRSLERFISIGPIEKPEVILIVGCVGFGLNLLSAAFVPHEHDHEATPPLEDGIGNKEARMGSTELIHTSHHEHRHDLVVEEALSPRDYGMMGVLLHVIGDAVNNIAVIISAAIIWRTNYGGRDYADPCASIFIAILILLSSLPLVKRTGLILLGSVPRGIDLKNVKHDLEMIPGILSVHDLCIWRLNEHKSIASAHVMVDDRSITGFMTHARTITQCLSAYGVDSVTLQPEFVGKSDGCDVEGNGEK